MILSVNAGGGYDVVIERGCLSRAGERLDLGRRVLLVTDDGVQYQQKNEAGDTSCSAKITLNG